MKKAGMLCALYLAVSLLSIHVQAQDQPSSKDTIAPPAITGTGTANMVTKWTGASALGNSHITDTTSGNVGIGTTSPGAKLDVNGTARIRGASAFNATMSLSAGNLDLPATTASTSGVVVQNNLPLIHTCCTSAVGNTFVGLDAGNFTTTSSTGFGYNTGLGMQALAAVTTGTLNTAVGASALQDNTAGTYNVADGYAALTLNQTGAQDVAIGSYALYAGQGSYDTALGTSALVGTTGSYNTAVGTAAGENNTSGSANTFLGYNAGPLSGTGTLSNAAAIGANTVVGASNAMILGGTGGSAVTVGIGTATPYNDYALDVETIHSNSLINGGVVVNANGGNLYLGMTNTTHKFRVDTNGVTYADGGFQSSGADFAESVEVRGKRSAYEPGDVLAIDQSAKRHLALSHHPYETLVAGIYSTKPGLLATPHNIDDPAVKTSEVPLAVVGIVPCKVTTENGAIRPGDLLVTSSRPGYAMKGTDRRRLVGAVVGKALEPLQDGTGSIQVLVTLQ